MTVIHSQLDVAKFVDKTIGEVKDNVSKAQFWLDSQIMNDMVPLMPRVSGTFINLTRARSMAMAGTGRVVAAAPPYGRYLYYGKVMVNSKTGKGPMKIEVAPNQYILRYPLGATLMPTNRDLHFSYPNAQPKWFEVAKRTNEKYWIKTVKKILVKGKV